MEEKIGCASGLQERVRLVEGFLLAQLHRFNKGRVSDRIQHIWRRGWRSGIRSLSRDLGIGERRLERECLRATGAPPKHLSRLSRFLQACRYVERGCDPLTEVAYLCGYHDQSHFIREFKNFSGLTPSQLRAGEPLSFFEDD